ncbi:MAG TPA: FkbM family methyltransferase [Roseiarcus sp.]
MTNVANLIFDLGTHNGQDSDFYLKKGFNVVAVEANPALCNSLRQRFAREITEGRYTLVEKAVGERFGNVDFFINTERSIWGTTAYNQKYRERSSAKVSPNWTKIVVPSVPFSWLTDQFGVPYYLKIDIEGADLIYLADLLKSEDRPKFISIERQPFLGDQLKDLGLLKALGYTRFKVIDQKTVMLQRPPKRAREGIYVEHRFEFDATGLLGEELPGRWLSYSGVVAHNAAIQTQSKGFGIWRRTPGLSRLRESWGSWYDFHAALPADEAGEDLHHGLRTSSEKSAENA